MVASEQDLELFLNDNFLQTKINFKIEAIYHFGGFQFLEALCF